MDEREIPAAAVAVATKAFMYRGLSVKWLRHFATNVPHTVARPLLPIDNVASSHHCGEIVAKAIELRIIMLLLPLNSTHLLQPLDVAVFKPFKASLHRGMDHFMVSEDAASLSKKQTLVIASSALEWGVSKLENVQVRFASTGVRPISSPEMRARKGSYGVGGVALARANPVWLTVREQLSTYVFFLPKPTAGESKRRAVDAASSIMTQEKLQKR